MSNPERLITLTERQRVRGGWLDFRVRNVTWAEAKAVKLRWLKAHADARVRGLGTDIRKFYEIGEWTYTHVVGTLTELDEFDEYCHER